MAQYNDKGIECVRSCDQKKYLHNEKKKGELHKLEFNPQKNISLLQDGRRFFVYSSNMAAVTSCEHTLYIVTILSSLTTHERKFPSCLIKVMNSTSASMPPGPFSNILPAYFSLWQT